ncbi:hypothetical protein [Chryseobacterium gossypii]|uniref:hypothetical protein n=1 Tax=Chryseobacterium gossypii TaxID=3231602 RepID=UPI003524924B
MKSLSNLLSIFAVCLLVSCSKEKTIDDELREAAASMNKLTPQTLSEGVRLDSVSAKAGKIFKYNYTLVEDVKENVTEANISSFKKEAKEEALNAIKTSADMKEFRDNDVTLQYVYYDKNGKQLAEFSVDPKEYKGK